MDIVDITHGDRAGKINMLSEGIFHYFLKGVFAKNERGYRLNAIKKRFWPLLILLLSVASIGRKLLKTSHAEFLASIQIEKIATYDLDCKKINLISNKSFRYYNL